MTGFVRWWFGCITSVKPDGALKLWPIIAWRIDVGGAGLFDGMRLHVEENIFGFGLTGSEPACACGSRENHRRDRFVADSPQEEAGFEPSVPRQGAAFFTEGNELYPLPINHQAGDRASGEKRLSRGRRNRCQRLRSLH
jgi:hypothetical protein